MLGPPLCGNSRTGGSLLADRALMSIERLSSEIGFRPRAGREDVSAEYVTWLDTHRGYHE